MDPITARAALRLSPATPLTVEQIDAAHHAEVQTYHASRYVDRAQRAAAVAWVQVLDVARATLLAELAPVAPAEPVVPASPVATAWAIPSGPVLPAPNAAPAGGDWAAAVAAGAPAGGPPAATATPAPPRRRRTGWIVGIAAGGVALLALIVGIGFGAVALGERLTALAESAEEASTDDGSVERYSARETKFTFPAALEFYFDGRYSSECPAEYEFGCWEAAVIPEASCAIMTVSYAYAATEEQLEPDLVESKRFSDVEAGETIPIVFGNDDYDYGWPLDVVCHDSTET